MSLLTKPGKTHEGGTRTGISGPACVGNDWAHHRKIGTKAQIIPNQLISDQKDQPRLKNARLSLIPLLYFFSFYLSLSTLYLYFHYISIFLVLNPLCCHCVQQACLLFANAKGSDRNSGRRNLCPLSLSMQNTLPLIHNPKLNQRLHKHRLYWILCLSQSNTHLAYHGRGPWWRI